MSEVTEKIEIMQSHLKELRSFAGWKQSDLAALLGVTQQNVSGLETCRSKLSKTQYIALRSLFSYAKTDRPLLGLALDLYFGPDNWKTELFEIDKEKNE